jgi:hypothetical protein
MVSSLQQGTQCRRGNTPRYRQAILHETQTNEHPCVVSVERMFLSLVAAPGQPGQPISQVISHTAQSATGCRAGKWFFILDAFVYDMLFSSSKILYQWLKRQTLKMKLLLLLYLSCYSPSLCDSQKPFSPFDFLGNLFKSPPSWTSPRQVKQFRSPPTRSKKSFRPHLPLGPSFSASQVFIHALLWNYVNM